MLVTLLALAFLAACLIVSLGVWRSTARSFPVRAWLIVALLSTIAITILVFGFAGIHWEIHLR